MQKKQPFTTSIKESMINLNVKESWHVQPSFSKQIDLKSISFQNSKKIESFLSKLGD